MSIKKKRCPAYSYALAGQCDLEAGHEGLHDSAGDGFQQDMKKPTVKLKGGNAFAIISACRRAAKDAGWKSDRIEEVTKEMKAGDYDHVLQTAMKHFDVEV